MKIIFYHGKKKLFTCKEEVVSRLKSLFRQVP